VNREYVLKQLTQEWETLLLSFADLPDSTIMVPNVVGHWSIRDVIAHITTWEEEALEALPLILQGKRLPRYTRYGGIDAFNAREQEQKRERSLAQLRTELTTTHERLITFLENCPEDAYTSGSRFLKRLRLDNSNHYREHSSQIRAWRAEREF
jgi:hypothetical protein